MDRSRVLDGAVVSLTASCMSQSGFRYPPLRVFRNAVSPPFQTVAGIGSPMTTREAEEHGYGRLIAAAQAPSVEAATSRYTSSLSEAARRRFQVALGTEKSTEVVVKLKHPRTTVSAPAQGCVARARRRLFGSIEAFLGITYLPQGIRRFTSGVIEDPAVQDARRGYVRCMAEGGYEVDFPEDAARLAERLAPGAAERSITQVSRPERALAMTDAACQESSAINDVIERELFDAATVWLQTHSEELLRLEKIRTRAVERARALRRGK